MKLLFRKSLLLAPLAVFFLYPVKFFLFGIPVTLLDSLLGLAIILGVSDIGIRRSFMLLLRRRSLSTAFIFIFIIASSAALLASGDMLAAAGQWKSVVVLPSLYGLILCSGLYSQRVTKRSVAVAALIGSCVVASSALSALFFQLLTYDNRLAFPYRSPNELAMVLSPIIAAIITWMIVVKKPIARSLWVILAVLIIPLMATRSAGGIAAALIGILGAFQATQRISWKRWIPSIVITASILFILYGVMSGWLIQEIQGRTSLHSRLEIWDVTLHLIDNYWLRGIGFGVFQEYYLNAQPLFPPYQEWAVPHPHNIFLAVFLGSGIVGLISFIGILFYVLGRVRIDPPFIAAASVMFIVMILHGFVDTTIFRNDLSVLFWAAMAVVLSSKSNQSKKKKFG